MLKGRGNSTVFERVLQDEYIRIRKPTYYLWILSECNRRDDQFRIEADLTLLSPAFFPRSMASILPFLTEVKDHGNVSGCCRAYPPPTDTGPGLYAPVFVLAFL